jgi:hypothetical protein
VGQDFWKRFVQAKGDADVLQGDLPTDDLVDRSDALV